MVPFSVTDDSLHFLVYFPSHLSVIISDLVQVSNDGYSYSNGKILSLYDGACQICSLNTEVLCTLRVRKVSPHHFN